MRQPENNECHSNVRDLGCEQIVCLGGLASRQGRTIVKTGQIKCDHSRNPLDSNSCCGTSIGGKTRSRFAVPLLALPSSRMKIEPLLKGQPLRLAYKRWLVQRGIRPRQHPSLLKIESASQQVDRIVCRPSTMSCRAAMIAITPTRSPFPMQARSVLARCSLPLMGHPSILRTLEELAASSTIRAAAKLFSVP